MFEISLFTVFIAALITAIATGLGSLPFAFVKKIPLKWIGLSNAVASGLMLGASYSLLAEAFRINAFRGIAGILVGVSFMMLLKRFINRFDDLHIGELQGANAAKALMIFGVMTLHSFAEGVGVGVSFGGGETLGTLITAAIAVHNIPEGLAISIVLVPRGVTTFRASLVSIASSLPQPLMAVPAYMFVVAFAPILPAGLAFAAGAMIWMVSAELIPDALEEASRTEVVITTLISFAAMVAFQLFVLA